MAPRFMYDVGGAGTVPDHIDESPSRVPAWVQALGQEHRWILTLVGTILAGVGVIALWYLGNYLSSPGTHLSGSALLRDEYDKARSQAEAIKLALEQMKKEEQLNKDEGARQRLDEQTASGMEVVADAEAQAAAATLAVGQTYEAATKVLAGGTEELLKNAAGHVAQQAGPVLARAEHAYNILQEESTGVKERLMEFAKGEATSLSMKLQEAFTLPEDQLTQLEKLKVPDMAEFMQTVQGKAGDWELPPISLFAAAIFAPAQLQWAKIQDQVHAGISALMVVVSLGCIITDWGQPCRDVVVWVWAVGFLSLSALDVMLRYMSIRRVAAGLAKLQEGGDTQKQGMFTTGNKIWDMMLQMQFSSDTVFRAFFTYNDLVNSWAFLSSRWLGLLLVFWNIFGLGAAMANAVEDSLDCDARAVVFWMRSRSFLFVFLFFWTLIHTVLTVIVRLHVVENAIMGAAVSADRGSDLPIYSILCRSLMMQEHTVELKIREAMVQEEVKVLQEEQARAAAKQQEFVEKVEKRTAIMNKIREERMAEEASTDAQRVEKYVKLAHEVLSKAEPFVAIAASRLGQQQAASGGGAAAAQAPEAGAAASSTS